MMLDAKEVAQRDAERATQVTNCGINWMREINEQNLNQSKAAIETLLKVTKQTVSGIDHQASAVCKSSMRIAEETLSNTFDFAHRLMRAKDMQELAQIQVDFVSRQAQVVGDETKELGQGIMQGVNELAKTPLEGAAEPARRRSEAA